MSGAALTRPVRLRGMGRFIDDILHIHDLALVVPEAVADDVPGPLQFFRAELMLSVPSLQIFARPLVV